MKSFGKATLAFGVVATLLLSTSCKSGAIRVRIALHADQFENIESATYDRFTHIAKNVAKEHGLIQINDTSPAWFQNDPDLNKSTLWMVIESESFLGLTLHDIGDGILSGYVSSKEYRELRRDLIESLTEEFGTSVLIEM